MVDLPLSHHTPSFTEQEDVRPWGAATGTYELRTQQPLSLTLVALTMAPPHLGGSLVRVWNGWGSGIAPFFFSGSEFSNLGA